MENIGGLEREGIIRVLSEGREVADELKRKLVPTVDHSREAFDILVRNIHSSYENAIKLLVGINNGNPSPMGLDSSTVPDSIQASPLTEEASHLKSKDQVHKSKNRKRFARWREQVKVRSETGFEGQADDGYTWRKYGQKRILGSNHPRAYYRCTHRNTQGCLATKQVQRIDNDPSTFEVVYRTKHTCMLERSKRNEENLLLLERQHKEECAKSSIQSRDTTIMVGPQPKPENQESVTKEDHFPSFSFPLTPFECENVETQFCFETSNFMGTNYSSRFLSTSESYFSSANEFGNDFGEIASNPTRLTNFSFGDLNFLINQIDFSSQLLDTTYYFN